MRQRISNLIKYNLLTALLAFGAMCLAVGATWCRYQKTLEASVQFVVQGPGEFAVLGADNEMRPGVWYKDASTGHMRTDFRVVHVSDNVEGRPEKHSFKLRMLASEGIPTDAQVVLSVLDAEGVRHIYYAGAEKLESEGKNAELYADMGDGVRYRFWENGKEPVFEIKSGGIEVVTCSIMVAGEVDSFLGEIQIVDTAYDNEINMLSGSLFDEEVVPTFWMTEWKDSNVVPMSEIYLSSAELKSEGTLTCSTSEEDSVYIVPTFVVEEMDVTEPIQSVEVQSKSDEYQGIKLRVFPQKEALQKITAPIVTTVTLTWTYPVGEEEVASLSADLKLVLHPVPEKPVVVPPVEPNAPVEPEGSTGTEEGNTSTEGTGSEDGATGSTEGTGSEDGATGSTEGTGSEDGATGSTEGTGSEDGATGSTEGTGSEDGATESTEGTGSEDGATESTEGTGSEDGATESTEGTGSEDGATESTEGAAEEEEATESTEVIAEEEEATESTEEISSESEVLEITELMEDIPIEEPEAESTEPSESEESEEGTEPAEGEEPEAGTEPVEGEEPETGTEPVEGEEPEAGTESGENIVPEESTEIVEEITGQTFVVKKSDGKQQMAISNLKQQLNIEYLANQQNAYTEEEEFSISVVKRILRTVSETEMWSFYVPISESKLEVKTEELTENGYVVLEDRVLPHAAVSEVTEGDWTEYNQVLVQSNTAPAGTYRLVIAHKNSDGLVLLEEHMTFFVNYRFENALNTEAQEE